ncbi:scarecrow-like protein 32 [Populus alba]|uniref:scarecrow-like protein 32 n=1 Tax=Populus alba TaxID=43335 RepID=UPI003CC78EEB
METELRGNSNTSISLQNPSLFNNPQSSLSGALKGCLGSLDGACIEKLLLHCASALEHNDGTLAQQVMWVLNNVASLVGDPNQRLTSWFLRALISRASKVCPTAMNFDGSSTIRRRNMSVTELAVYVDLIPWHRFGFCASNSAILKAIEGYSKVHILDFSITHCMQWPTLIDALAIRDVPFEFNVFDHDPSSFASSETMSQESSHDFHIESLLNHLTPTMLDLRDDEALVINCQNWLRYLSDEEKGNSVQDCSLRDAFLCTVKGFNPCIVVVVDEDSDLSAPSLSSRITTCFNFLWIPFDALETFLLKDSSQRIEYESDIGHKIENIISFEGAQRIERSESGIKLAQRMKNAGFSSVPFCVDTIGEVRSLLEEHASGWGMKREEDHMLVLTWKGHNSVFSTAWVPNGLQD